MANNGPKANAAQVDAAIAADAGRSGQAFVKDISAWVAKAKGNMDQVVRGVALELGSRVIQRTPVDTGRAKANWRYSEGSPDTATTESANQAESLQRLNNGIRAYSAATGKSIFITNALPYIKRLEYGWSVKQAPEGMVRITAAEFLGIVKEQVAFVRSGGKG